MKELFKFLRHHGNGGSGYDADEAMFSAVAGGLIKKANFVGAQDVRERRWGTSRIYVYEVDTDKLVAIEVYVQYSEYGEDQFEDVYEVEPYEVTKIEYRRVDD